MAEDAQSNDQILHDLDALSHTMYQSHSKRRTTSFALPRSTTGDSANAGVADGARPAAAARPPSRRMSMSPLRSRPTKLDKIDDDDYGGVGVATPLKSQSFGAVATTPSVAGERKGIWGWRPIRTLSHIGMHRVGCLFSVEVVAAQGLPASMNGLRLVVTARKESRHGAVQTVPSRVQHGAAEFEETLFVRCSLYCRGGGKGNKPLRFEPRPFLVTVVAVDAPELDFGRSVVDLSLLVKESTEKDKQGERVRQWDMAFPLAGKAKGGELVVKLAFQIMEGGGVGLYSQPAVAAGGKNAGSSSASSSFARKQSKSSFSIASPKQVTRAETSLTPTTSAPLPDLQGIDDFKLDEPSTPLAVTIKQKEPEPEELNADDSEFPDFDVVDKGVEEREPKEEEVKAKEEEKVGVEEKASSAARDEVVKEVVHDSAHAWRRNELEAITNQIRALELMMLREEEDDSAHTFAPDAPAKPAGPQVVAGLDADEDEVTRQFLQLLEQQGDDMMEDARAPPPQASSLKPVSKPGSKASDVTTCYVSDLGKALGPIVQTRDGGYLAAMNPFDVPVARKELPKLVMHLSKPFILRDQRLPTGGAEVFQRLCTGGLETFLAKIGALVTMDDVVGKTAEQIALEGMASAIVTARGSNKDLVVASSSAAESVSLLRTMAAATSHGRQDRVTTGIWNAHDAPVPVDEVLAVSLQRIEAMAVDALKVQADMTDHKSPFEVSPAAGENPWAGHVLDAAVPPEEWASACDGVGAFTMIVVVQLRDPLRRYEAVGAPSLVVIQAGRVGGAGVGEPKFKVANMHLGGLRLKSADRRNVWDGEKQRLTAMHWLVGYGLGKVDGGRKSRAAAAAKAKAGNEVLWSMSSSVMTDMWLKPIRNPDVKITM